MAEDANAEVAVVVDAAMIATVVAVTANKHLTNSYQLSII